MSKRAYKKFKRNRRDLYRTRDPRAFRALLRFLSSGSTFCEPCAAYGDLVCGLEAGGLIVKAVYDIKPGYDFIEKKNARSLKKEDLKGAEFIITNPPWSRPLLHFLINRFRKIAPTWLLFDADWAFTDQAIPYMQYCEKFVAVGRLCWMDNGVSGMDNCAWYLFGDEKVRTQFYPKGRV